MIVAVKRSKKQKFIKIISLLILAIALVAYYFHMSNKYEQMEQKDLEKKRAIKIKEISKNRQKIMEQILINEAEKAVDLIGQENVEHVKMIEKKIVIVCEANTNLEALKVRYGAMALIKKSSSNLVIVIDANSILENRLNET